MQVNKTLKIKYRHLDLSFGHDKIKLPYHIARTVAKHNYKSVQLDGKIYSLSVVYIMPKHLGYIPFVQVLDVKDDLYESDWYAIRQGWK